MSDKDLQHTTELESPEKNRVGCSESHLEGKNRSDFKVSSLDRNNYTLELIDNHTAQAHWNTDNSNKPLQGIGFDSHNIITRSDEDSISFSIERQSPKVRDSLLVLENYDKSEPLHTHQSESLGAWSPDNLHTETKAKRGLQDQQFTNEGVDNLKKELEIWKSKPETIPDTSAAEGNQVIPSVDQLESDRIMDKFRFDSIQDQDHDHNSTKAQEPNKLSRVDKKGKASTDTSYQEKPPNFKNQDCKWGQTPNTANNNMTSKLIEKNLVESVDLHSKITAKNDKSKMFAYFLAQIILQILNYVQVESKETSVWIKEFRIPKQNKESTETQVESKEVSLWIEEPRIPKHKKDPTKKLQKISLRSRPTLANLVYICKQVSPHAKSFQKCIKHYFEQTMPKQFIDEINTKTKEDLNQKQCEGSSWKEHWIYRFETIKEAIANMSEDEKLFDILNLRSTAC